jgi:hypothetical protein
MCCPEWFHLRHGSHAYSHEVYETDGMSFFALSYPLDPFMGKKSSTSRTLWKFIAKKSRSSIRSDAVSHLLSALLWHQTAQLGNIQFDDPGFAFFCSTQMLDGLAELNIDDKKLLNLYMKVYNDILSGRPKDLRIGVHICRGNYKVTFVITCILRFSPFTFNCRANILVKVDTKESPSDCSQRSILIVTTWVPTLRCTNI